jgi:hypothetical protein
MDRPLGGIPAETMARFVAAESRLYPMALSDPSAYERATALVGSSLTSCGEAAPTYRRCSSGALSSSADCRSWPRTQAFSSAVFPRRPWSMPRPPCAAGSWALADDGSAQCRSAALTLTSEPAFTKDYESCREVDRPGERNEHG